MIKKEIYSKAIFKEVAPAHLQKFGSITLVLALALGLDGRALAGNKVASPIKSAPASKGKMLVLKSDGELYGPSLVKFSDLGFSIRTRIGGLLWLKSRPNVYVQINPENKTYLENTPKEYFDDLRDEYPTIVADRIVSKPGAPVKGRPTTAHTIYRKDRDGSEIVCAEVNTIRRDIVDPQVCKAWCYLLTYQGSEDSLPVSVKQGRRRGRHIFDQMRDNMTKGHPKNARRNANRTNQMWNMVSTSEVTIEPLDPSAFTLPKGLNKAKDRASLYLSVDGDIKKGDIEDLFMRELK